MDNQANGFFVKSSSGGRGWDQDGDNSSDNILECC